jgi:hypothetical protein
MAISMLRRHRETCALFTPDVEREAPWGTMETMYMLLTRVNDMKAGQGRFRFRHIVLLRKISKRIIIVVTLQIDTLIKYMCIMPLRDACVWQFVLWKARLLVA